MPWETLQAIGNNLGIAHRIAWDHQRLELPRESRPYFPDLEVRHETRAAVTPHTHTHCMLASRACMCAPLPLPPRQTYNALITDCFQEDPAARPKMEVVLERLVALQQLMVKRQREEAANAAAGGAPPGNGGIAPSANGQSRPTIAIGGWVKSYPSGPPCTPGLASPGRSFSAATRRASNAAAAAAAAAAEQWHHQVKAPSRGWLLVAGACRAHVACLAREHMARLVATWH